MSLPARSERGSGSRLIMDRLEITDLLYRYAELIDAGDFDGVGQLLARATFAGTRGPATSGAHDIAALFAATTRRFPEAGNRPRTRHLLLNAIVDVDGAAAGARSTFCVVQQTDTVALQPIVVGRYDDVFARDQHGWHFTARQVDVEMVGDISEHLMFDYK